MHFRFKAFSLHLLASAIALSLILGSLYLGWYRWPGWRLADVTKVVLVMVCVDLVLGPLLTFIVANKSKPRRELTRDIGIIVAVQLCALTYGSISLWNGRPLYYAFSVNVLQLVQAYDINSAEAEIGRDKNPSLAPHWYSLPRWIWAPLPDDAAESDKIVAAAVSGGDDVISMPKYFRPWEQGLPSLRQKLKKVDNLGYFVDRDKKVLKQRMKAANLPDDQPDTMVLTGRGQPMAAVFDLGTLKVEALFSAE